MEGAGESDPDVELKQMLELQLSEVEFLSSMFPNPGEFKLDDRLALKETQSFVAGRTRYEFLNSRIGFTIAVKLSPKCTVEVVCHLPHEYPMVPPEIFTRAPEMNRDGHSRMNESLHEFIIGLDRGEICIGSVIQWIEENADKFMKTKEKAAMPEREDKKMMFTRLWIYSHHIYSKSKRQDIIGWAQDLDLTGFSVPGKPGIVCVEGHCHQVEEYWLRLRRLNWKKLTVKDREEIEIKHVDVENIRKFSVFEEKCFDVRGGKGREYHMDFGKFYEFLNEHGVGKVFSLYFGVDGRSSST